MFFSAAPLLTSALLLSGVLGKTTSNGGSFAVTVNGVSYDTDTAKKAKFSTCTGAIKVRGVNVGYDIDCATLAVQNYTLTGAPDSQRMVTRPTVVFAVKQPELSATQLRGATISDFDLKADVFNIIFKTSGGKIKVQSKDGAQGGIFQMEPEFATNVNITHVLGPELFYFNNPNTRKINFGNGESGDETHQMLLGKDSPQVATKLFQDGRMTRWSVASGGRMGGVLGEDAVELSQGATQCTSKCQAQNRLQGSVPVPADPVNPAPLPGA